MADPFVCMRIVNCELVLCNLLHLQIAFDFMVISHRLLPFIILWYGKNGMKSSYWSGCKVYRNKTYLLRITFRLCEFEQKKDLFRFSDWNFYYISFFLFRFFTLVLTIFIKSWQYFQYVSIYEIIIWSWIVSSHWIELWLSYLFCLFDFKTDASII